MRITNISDNGLAILKTLEGFRAKPYLDGANVPTIGFGNTYYTDGSRVKLSDTPIDKTEATSLLNNLLVHFERTVDSYTRDDVTQCQFDALVCFTYNCGTNALKTSTLLRYINAYRSENDIRAQFMRWDKVDGVTDKGLRNRRIAEIKLYFDGK